MAVDENRDVLSNKHDRIGVFLRSPGDMAGNLTSTETNMTVQAGRYTSEGWMDAVRVVIFIFIFIFSIKIKIKIYSEGWMDAVRIVIPYFKSIESLMT